MPWMLFKYEFFTDAAKETVLKLHVDTTHVLNGDIKPRVHPVSPVIKYSL